MKIVLIEKGWKPLFPTISNNKMADTRICYAEMTLVTVLVYETMYGKRRFEKF